MTTSASAHPDNDHTRMETGGSGGSATPVRNSGMKLGTKLSIGFGVLVFITLLVVVVSYLGSAEAMTTINRTEELRVPKALASSRAQADLLRMLSSVRGYLALDDPQVRARYRDDYEAADASFQRNLAELEELSSITGSDNDVRLTELTESYQQWSELPEQLFELRDNQLKREPAIRMLIQDAQPHIIIINKNANTLLSTQARSATPSAENMELLEDMATFQSSFASMVSGIRGYVTTRRDIFRTEYESSLFINKTAWERLENQRNRLSEPQQQLLDEIAADREAFLELPEQMFEAAEGPRAREDLYLFTTEAVPLANTMIEQLDTITADQQNALQQDLNRGQRGLKNARWQTLIGGVVALLFGTMMALVFRANIAGPVRRLTATAERIRAGHLDAEARVETHDEIGTFAETFNSMTAQLRATMQQIRNEKKRTDDLLGVVIPIGVALSSERDFNRLLENMLIEAKTFCNADSGALFLCEGPILKLVMLQNTSQQMTMGGTSTTSVDTPPLPIYDDNKQPRSTHTAAYVVHTATSLTIDASTPPDKRLPSSSQHIFGDDYPITSLLAIPLINNRNDVLGVIELINPQDATSRDVLPFDPNLQQMMESFSSLATAALESYIREYALRQEIQQLRIEIDEAKRQQQVSEIVETDFFQDLRTKARELRQRGQTLASQAAQSGTEQP